MKAATISHMDTTRLTFGKYKGQTLGHIAQFDPTYLDWMKANGLCDETVILARDRGLFTHKKLKAGYAYVWTGGKLTHANGRYFS